ncbi:MBL fold metallo-hydrolase [Desulfitobacterium metallireducens]|nr:MBL fold metallo-hydrolase [Desulfitobacterium metallireducens]
MPVELEGKMIYTVPVTGVFITNMYFLIDEKTKHGFLIDPGASADLILQVIKRYGFQIEKILITHGHFDHIGAAEIVSNKLRAPIYIHEKGKRYITDPIWNLSEESGLKVVLRDVQYLNHGDVISLESNPNIMVHVIYVPGHTTDSIVFYSKEEKAAFVGDSIFKGSLGRSDFYGGDEVQLFTEVITKILTLPEDTVLYSGHSEPTTVGIERARIYKKVVE